MNFYRKTFFASAIALSAFAFALSSLPVQAEPRRSDESKSHASSPSPVVAPSVPENVTFAGVKISLDPVNMWERLDRELTAMSYTHTNTLLTIKRANRYFPVIAPILKKNNIPADMVYLAAIESTMNTKAISGAKAGGLWQFMPATAREYGLEVNDNVDERFDPEKSTEAACRYLRNAYAKYGNWESVAASYNGGMGRISGELSSQQVSSAYDLYLADETMRYIFRLLAMKLIMENPSDYGFVLTADNLYQPLDYKIVEVSTPVEDWPTWAIAAGIDYLTLREHNPWIRSKTLPNKTGKTYRVKIPTKDSLSRSSSKKSVYDPRWVVD